MDSKKLTTKQFRQMIENGQASDPLIFLEALMNGQDIRKTSKIHEMVSDIVDFNGDEPPSPDEWRELVEAIDKEFRYDTVGLSVAFQAAKTLAEYIHPKLKNLNVSGEIANGERLSTALTEEEIELFKERFNDEF